VFVIAHPEEKITAASERNHVSYVVVRPSDVSKLEGFEIQEGLLVPPNTPQLKIYDASNDPQAEGCELSHVDGWCYCEKIESWQCPAGRQIGAEELPLTFHW